MHIAIDASRTTVAQRTGTENYALQIILALLALPTDHQFSLFFRDEPSAGLFPNNPNVQHIVIPSPRAWTHTRFAWEIWRHKPDVTWVPAHTLPFLLWGRAVVTIHDLGYKLFPQAHPPRERWYLELTTRYSAWRATRIMADSIATQNDLEKYYQVDSDNVDVVYPAIDTTMEPDYSKRLIEERYLLFIGTLQPRKNIKGLAQAFDQWRTQNPQHSDVMLVLGGKAGWLYEPNWTDGIENIKLLGYVADEDLASLYTHAEAFLFPSLYEGFGFPVLEAMCYGTPVLCSNTSSLVEVGGDAALQVDPSNIEEIAKGIGRLMDDKSLRETLVRKGHEHVKQFTWKVAAQAALETLESAAQ